MHLHRPETNGRMSRRPATFSNYHAMPGRTFNDVAGESRVAFRPEANMKETKEAYTIMLAAPGLKKEAFDIRIVKDMLTVKAQAEQSWEGKIQRREFDFSKFQRSFRLPEDADMTAVSATYEDGILSIVLPKAPEAQERKIDIK